MQDRLVTLLPDAWGEYRDRGLAHAEQGHTARAVRDLETYLAHAEDALDIDAIADRVAALAPRRELTMGEAAPQEPGPLVDGAPRPALGARHRFQGVQPVLPVADVRRAAR